MNRLQQVNGRLLRIWQYAPEIKPPEMAIEGQVELALIAQTVLTGDTMRFQGGTT